MSMGTITKMQNEIAGLQATLQERNRKIAALNVDLSGRNTVIAELNEKIKALTAPKASEQQAAA